MRISMAYLVPTGIFLGVIGLIITLVGLGARAWLTARRPDSERRWKAIPVVISAPGQLFEMLGLFLLLMAIFNTLTLRLRINIESQILLTLYLVIVPMILSVGIVLWFNRFLLKPILRKRKAAQPADPHTIREG